ncbi:MAG: ribonuclease Z [Clostridia bacterium]|nr:ribonuclease Z [Clostridia bacterium]
MRWETDRLKVEVLFSQGGLATQILVQAGPIQLLFDAGDGTLRDLLSRGYDPLKLYGIFLTHGHADHMAGLYGLLGFLRAEGRSEELLVAYPAGACEVETILKGFHTCYMGSMPFSIQQAELVDGDVLRLPGGSVVLARSVRHWHSIQGKPISPAPALGYRLSLQGKVIAITGDSTWCPALEELVKGADLALIEASLDEPGEASEKIHLTLRQARELARLARNAFLIHRPDGKVLWVD